MRFVYFTKTLQSLDLPGVVDFLRETGLQGADLAVRPGYPVNPDNVQAELPRAVKRFQDAGLSVGLVTAPTSLNDPTSASARTLFEACGKAGVPAIKIGYFPYEGRYDAAVAEARRRLADFARLADRTGVKACYHTHSGNYLGNNAAGLRQLLQDLDPHHVGAFVDTGHTALNGGPFRMELDILRPWLSLVAVKDMRWERMVKGWQAQIVPAGEGIVRFDDVARGLKESGYNGTISLHGEYEARDLAERKALAKKELTLLKGLLG
jgi:sugar phosphate isomerase/epimerase